MFIKQLKCVFMPVIIHWIFSSIPSMECQSLLPTQEEQVNLLTSTHQLLEQIKHSAMAEQNAMDEAVRADLDLSMKRFFLIISTLDELTLLKLTSRSNAVCALDAKDKMVIITKEALAKLNQCAKTGKETLTANSFNLTAAIESGITTAEDFLDKLNLCSESRGFAVIACYKKIIQNDVLPTKDVLSEAIGNHEKGHIETFRMKAAFDQCAEETIESFKGQLDLALEMGLNCT